MRIGFIGLGTMGAPIAMNLIRAGRELVVHDANRSSADSHIAAGAEWKDTPSDVARVSNVIFTSLPGPQETEIVALGPNGLIEGAQDGTIYFDLSTNSPTTLRKIAAALVAKGIETLDAPVSGGPHGAASRKMAIWVGGNSAAFDKCKSILETIGDQISYIGPLGHATIVKLVHNCTAYAINLAVVEAFTMGVKAGMDPLTLFKSIRRGAVGRQRTYDALISQFLPGKFEPAAFALKLAHKDVSLAVALGREVDVPMRLCQMMLQDMSEALDRGWGQRDSRSALLLQEERAGVQIAVDPDALRQAIEDDSSVLINRVVG